MKKDTLIGFAILFIFWIGCALVSCVPDENVSPMYKNERISIGGNSNIVIRVVKFEYDGHRYIMFGGEVGVVHDPDCPCRSGEPIYMED